MFGDGHVQLLGSKRLAVFHTLHIAPTDTPEEPASGNDVHDVHEHRGWSCAQAVLGPTLAFKSITTSQVKSIILQCQCRNIERLTMLGLSVLAGNSQ